MPTTTTSKASTLNLDTLLSHLQLRGIAVGTVEMQRLQAVFIQSPQLSRIELLNLLSALLAKDKTQRDTLNKVFNRLVPFEHDEAVQGSLDNDEPRRKPPQDRQDQPSNSPDDIAQAAIYKGLIQRLKVLNWRHFEPISIFYGVLGVLAVVILGLSLWAWDQSETTDTVKEHYTQTENSTSKPIDKIPDAHPLNLVKSIDYWSATVESKVIDPWPQLLPWLALLFASGVAFAWLFHKALKTTRRQTLKPPNIESGKGRFHFPELRKQAEYHLLSGEQRREMSWGISRYISEQTLSRLDIKRSVDSSAKAGLPQIEFLKATKEREVWLWKDQLSTNEDLERLSEEISHSLQRGNISVQRGNFRGLPSTVRNAQQEVIWSSNHEYPENAPLVVIFADAETLSRQQQQNPERTNTTLRQLSQWQHLCFVDSSQQPGTLQRLLPAPKITCLLPQAVAHWLTQQGQDLSAPLETCSLDSLQQWAIACALPTRQLTEDEVRAVHDAVGLSCAWQFHALGRYGVKIGDKYNFLAQRVELLNEIGVGITELKQPIPEFVKRAIRFWQDRNTEIDAVLSDFEISSLSRNIKAPKRKWNNTIRQQTLMLDTALLQLWRTPNKAANALENFYAEPELRKQIGQQLNQYCCAEFVRVGQHEQNTQIQLPFSWNELGAETQRQLLHCGFGGMPDNNVRLRWDNVTRHMLAGFACIMMMSFVVSSAILIQDNKRVITRLDSPEPLESLRIPHEQAGRYLAATYKSLGHHGGLTRHHESIRADHQLTVTWRRNEAQAAQFDIDNDPKAQLWLLGEKAKPNRPVLKDAEWPDLSIAVINGNPKNMTLRHLAAKLLDTGSADQVLLGKGGTFHKHLHALMTQAEPIQYSQWLYVGMPVPSPYLQNKNQRIVEWQKSPQSLLAVLNSSDKIIQLPAMNEDQGESVAKLFLQTESVTKSIFAVYKPLYDGTSIVLPYSDTILLLDKIESGEIKATAAEKLRVAKKINQVAKSDLIKIDGHKAIIGELNDLVEYRIGDDNVTEAVAERLHIMRKAAQIARSNSLNLDGYVESNACASSGVYEYVVTSGDSLSSIINSCAYKVSDSRFFQITTTIQANDILIFQINRDRSITKLSLDRENEPLQVVYELE